MQRIITFMFFALLSVTIVHAQDDDMCPPFILDAVFNVGSNCDGLDNNNACYGYNRISSTFTQDNLADDFFSLPGDFSELNLIETLQTSPLDIDVDEWGIALLRIQANLPNTLPGQSVRMILLGDMSLENGVEPADALKPSDVSLILMTESDTVMRSHPAGLGEDVTSITAGHVVTADAISGDWVRVIYDQQPGWINRAALAADADLSTLPTITSSDLTPMQAFYFTNGIGAPGCEQAPNTMLVQGPDNILVDITANGANIRIGSTLVLRTNATRDTMDVITVNGTVTVNPDTPDAIEIEAGYKTSICLTEEQDLGIDGEENNYEINPENCNWTEPQRLTAEELNELAILEQIPPELLNYPIVLPEEIVTPEPIIIPNEDDLCEIRADWTDEYLVQSGDTVTLIAASRDLTVFEIAEGNCLDNPDLIVTGSTIFLPPVVIVSQPPPQPAVPTVPAAPTPTTITMIGGSGQSTQVTGTFGAQLVAEVRDQFGTLMSNIPVTFSFASTGASAAFPGFGTSAIVNTDVNGIATSSFFNANTIAGNHTASATCSGCNTVTYSLTNEAGAIATLVLLDGDNQGIATNYEFADNFQVRAEDTFGNPIAGAPVQFDAPTFGASGYFTGPITTASAVANISGVATAPAFYAGCIVGAPYNITATSGMASVTIPNLQNNPLPGVTSNLDIGPGTLRDVIDHACPGSLVSIPAMTIQLASSIVIDQNITLQGQPYPNSVIDGQGITRHFDIAAGSIVTINDLVMMNGFSAFGGSIENAGTLNLNDVVIKLNIANPGNGGGIHNTGILNIFNSTIRNNNASSGIGGGIHNVAGATIVTIIDSCIMGNSDSNVIGAGDAIHDSSTGIHSALNVWWGSVTGPGNPNNGVATFGIFATTPFAIVPPAAPDCP